MKKRIIIALAIVLSLLIGGSLLLLRSPRKPAVVYQGKTAEQWLGEIFTTNQPAARMAFRQMGTNADPVLIDAFKKKDSVLSKSYAALYQRLPASWRQHLARPVWASELWNGAELVLINNQSHARSLLPELARILRIKSIGSRLQLASVVSSVVSPGDEECIPALVDCVRSDEVSLRLAGINGLARVGRSAKNAAPALTPLLAHPDPQVRLPAAWALWKIDHETNLSVPVLRRALTTSEVSWPTTGWSFDSNYWALIYLYEINSKDTSLIPAFVYELRNPDPETRNRVLMFLGNYGKAASAAVPRLTNYLTLEDAEFRERGLEALKKIDPDTAAKYESK